jgi:hypothetical protein
MLQFEYRNLQVLVLLDLDHHFLSNYFHRILLFGQIQHFVELLHQILVQLSAFQLLLQKLLLYLTLHLLPNQCHYIPLWRLLLLVDLHHHQKQVLLFVYQFQLALF